VVIAAVPLIAGISTLLLATISSLFSEQLHGLMILSVVATATTLAVKEFRRDTNR
jgi:NhaP-type Na+/H+ or K+/H+ antiporter